MSNDKRFLHVGCYVRVSTDNQLENYSIDEQIERLKAYCVAKNWVVGHVYTDGGFSGGNTNRPALQQMLSDIHAGLLDMVIVYKLDRLSRSQKDTLSLIEDEFIASGVEFVSMSENFDTSTPFGRAMIGILSVFAQLEKDQITERFTMGRIGRSKAGLYHGGPTAPTGYKYIDGVLVVDPYASEQVKESYSLFLSGYSINSIQRQLHAKYGGWNSAALTRNILKNSVYIGKVKFRGVEYDGQHDPIINEKDYHRVQELLESPEREAAKTAPQKTPFRAEYMLSSLIYCDRCGARYSANHGYYKCYSRAKSSPKFITDPTCQNRNWPISSLDDFVIDEILSLKVKPDDLEPKLRLATSEPNVDDQAALIERVREIDIQIKRMIDLYQIGSIPLDDINLRIDLLNKEKAHLNQQISKQKAPMSSRMERFRSLLTDREILLKGDIERKRLFISSIIESIRIDDDAVKIIWRI